MEELRDHPQLRRFIAWGVAEAAGVLGAHPTGR
jgi:hypothetical protein